MPSQIIILPDGRLNLWDTGEREWIFSEPLDEAAFLDNRRENAKIMARSVGADEDKAADHEEAKNANLIALLKKNGPEIVYRREAVKLSDVLSETLARRAWRPWETDASDAIIGELVGAEDAGHGG